MPKFTRNPERIVRLKQLRDAIEDELRQRTKEQSDFDSFRMGEVMIWLKMRDGSFINARLLHVQLDYQDEWKSQRPTARGSVYLLKVRGGTPFWVDLLDVEEAYFRKPADYVPSGHPFG